MKLSRTTTGIIIFVVLLILIYYAHINFFSVNVVFYAAITDALLATFITALLLWGLKFFSVLNDFEKSLLVIIFIISGYSIAISVPTVIDRSLSFYILEKLQQRGGGIKQNSFEQVFTQEYVREHRLVDVRLTEQLESGTIIIENACVLLTEKGKRLVNFSRYFRQHWLPKQRLLMGEYSDDLTDPFRNSAVDYDYKCKKR